MISVALMLLAAQTTAQESGPDTDASELLQRTIIAKSGTARAREVGADSDDNEFLQSYVIAKSADERLEEQNMEEGEDDCYLKADALQADADDTGPTDADDEDVSELWQRSMILEKRMESENQELLQRSVIARKAEERLDQQDDTEDEGDSDEACNEACKHKPASVADAERLAARADLHELMQRTVIARSAEERMDIVQAVAEEDLQELLQRGVIARKAIDREDIGCQNGPADEGDEDSDQGPEIQVATQAADAQQLMQRGVVARTAAQREEQLRNGPDADVGHASRACQSDSNDDDSELAGEMQVALQAADAQELMQRGVVARTAAQREEQLRNAPDAEVGQANFACRADSSDDLDDDVEQAGEMQVALQAADAQELMQRGVVARSAAQREEQLRSAPEAEVGLANFACQADSDDDDFEQAGEMQVALQAADAQELMQRGVVARTAAQREEQQLTAPDTDLEQAIPACRDDSADDDNAVDDDHDVAELASEMQVAAQAADLHEFMQRGVVARTAAQREADEGQVYVPDDRKHLAALPAYNGHACKDEESEECQLDENGFLQGSAVIMAAPQEADENIFLQQSVLSRSGSAETDEQPDGVGDQGGPGVEMRNQIRDIGGVCGRDVSLSVGSGCPEACPLTARDLSSGQTSFCTFACVPATEAACVAYSPAEPIPDEVLGICRAAAVKGCWQTVEPSATMTVEEMDRCAVCSSGYMLMADGSCESLYKYLWYSLFSIVLVFLLAVVAWILDLANRPIINYAGIEHGLATRSRSKLHTPKVLSSGSSGLTPRGSADAGSGRQLWPLTTNLCTTMVAGPGLNLHFNFMAVVIVWSCGIVVGWIVFAYAVGDSSDGNLFNVGTREAVTPAETCAVVSWGAQMHETFMRSQAIFVSLCYLWSFGLFVSFSVYQLRLYENLDERETTHMDFCAVLEGLPAMTGNEKIEEELSEEIERFCGQRPVGVSMTWEIADLNTELMNLIDENLDALHNDDTTLKGCDGLSMRASRVAKDQKALIDTKKETKTLKKGLSGRFRAATGLMHPLNTQAKTPQSPRSPRSPRFMQPPIENFMRRLLMSVERMFLAQSTQTVLSKGRRRDFDGRHTEQDVSSNEDFEVETELRAMHSCRTAFAVFDSEEARDFVVDQASRTNGLCFRNTVVLVKQAEHEPDSVCWSNFKDQHVGWKVLRVLVGVLTIILALVIWTVLFYLPYAFYCMSFNYGQGQWPGVMQETTFVMIIVCGNATMYFLCSEVADRCGFQYVGNREMCYLLLYYFACTLNVILDMVCAYQVVYMALVGVGSRTAEGVPLADLDSFQDRFESYPMQRELGWTVFAYSFPCTFLLPFLAEPIATTILPYKIMTAIVGYRPDIQGCRADAFLACTPFDLSRYADIALNVVLATLVFWFPSGLTLTMFATLAISHVYIYVYDHYRVLRSVPSFSVGGMRTDWWAQTMLSVPCGLLISCAVYKSNCVEGFERFHFGAEGVLAHCSQHEMLVAKCVLAFVVHVVVHLFILTAIVPLFGHSTKEPTKSPYSECARRLPHSYFSVSPVHCLRSEHIYAHNPPFVFSRAGKEHLMPQNPAIGAYFCDSSAGVEDYSAATDTLASLKRFSSVRNPRVPKGDSSRRRSKDSSAGGEKPRKD